MAVLVVLIVFVLLIIGFLLVPIDFYINTERDEYYLRLKGLATVSMEHDQEEVIKLKLKTLFFHHYFYPLRGKSSKKQKKIKDNKKTGGKNVSIKRIVALLKSFKVKRFVLDIDTGDCIANAKLAPLFAFLNYYVAHFSVNFEDRNFLLIHLHNRPINLIKSFINTKT
ncbi:hypothetical protein DKG77_15180 [Flagellimonas aquimarina]|jgi:hypothetical protein|uniref:DUF2953 domain-containing protein n=1 Tax=Flagellimonas aquimarina TaxID=2201895 RepID=A0A316KY24_9FLAO|nr:hypothetical protein [Allomuricauda koreensis]PWL37639.1 hypothetical protein DKG77_15180 [Allomuricauda koreensis]